jgi:hypothetical protein
MVTESLSDTEAELILFDTSYFSQIPTTTGPLASVIVMSVLYKSGFLHLLTRVVFYCLLQILRLDIEEFV